MSQSDTTPLDKQRARDLDGLMAVPGVTPLQHSVFRSLLYLGEQNNRERAIECSFAWLGERGGRDGKRARRARDENRGVDEAFHQLRNKGWLEAEARPRGRGFIYSVLLTAAFSAKRVPEWPYAATAVKRLSLQVSPVGPWHERSYCELVWALDCDGQRTANCQGWAKHLKMSRSPVVKHLTALAAADIGVTLEILPPEEPPAGTKRRGRPGPRYRVSAILPPRGQRPGGAQRHRAREAQAVEMVRELTTKASEPGRGSYMDGPDGQMVWRPAEAQDYDYPWDDEADGSPSLTADEGDSPPIVAAEEPIPTAVVAGDATIEEPRPGQTEHEAPAPAAAGDTSELSRVVPQPTSAHKQLNLEAELARLSGLVWHKELLRQAMDLAELQLTAGRTLSVSRRLNNFVRPVIALQDKYKPPLLKYALEQTIAGPPLHQPDTHGWVKYLEKVCENNCARFTGAGPPSGTNAAVKAAHSPERIREHLRSLQREAYDLNKRNETEPARALLWRMLAAVPTLAPALYEDDPDLARASIVESFKRGSSEQLTEELRGPAAFLNYLPESAWPHTAPLEGEPEPASAVKAETTAPAGDAGPPSTAKAAPVNGGTRQTPLLDRFPSQPMDDFEDSARR